VTISFNTLDSHKKIALAIAAMWQTILGVKVNLNSQEWKSFIDARQNGNYQIARDGWFAGNAVTDYTEFIYSCNLPSNNSHYCDPTVQVLIDKARMTADIQQKQALTQQALTRLMNSYSIIPLYQYTYSRLVKPYVHGYYPKDNYNDFVLSQWLYLAK
jgi:oligopeptide transport system substrate-binding protein